MNPALCGFSAEYRGDARVYDGFDPYERSRTEIKEILPKPITKVWRWRP